MDAPCSTKTIRWHLYDEKIKHKKRIHHLRLTMKHKERRLEYARQYQTMSTVQLSKTFLFQAIQFSQTIQFSTSMQFSSI